MNIKKIGAIMLCGASVTTAQWASADDSSMGMTSVTSQSSLMESIAEKTSLNYYGVYRGAPLNDMGNSLQPSPNGQLDPSAPLSVESIVTSGYRFDKTTSAGVMTHFYYFPIGNPAKSGQDLQMLDPLLYAEKKGIINDNGFRLTGRLTVQLPLTNADSLKAKNLLSAISPTYILNYDVPNTPLTVGLFGYFRWYLAGSDTLSDARTYKIYAAPNASYQLSQKVAATLWVDLLSSVRTGGTGFLSGMQNDPIDIEPGFNWDITKNVSLNPFLNLYPSNLTLASTSIQAVLTAKAF